MGFSGQLQYVNWEEYAKLNSPSFLHDIEVVESTSDLVATTNTLNDTGKGVSIKSHGSAYPGSSQFGVSLTNQSQVSANSTLTVGTTSESSLILGTNSVGYLTIDKFGQIKLNPADTGAVVLSSGILSTVDTTPTEITYVHGVTSSIQTQLNTKAVDTDVVHDSGDETIAGNKTFSSFPVTPSAAPDADYEVANKKYVDDIAGASGAGASTALSNLASVAVNTSLVSDTNNTDDLGSSSIAWKDLYLTGAIKTGSTTALKVNSVGAITQPVQPCFLATTDLGPLNVTGDGTLVSHQFEIQILDFGSNYDPTTSTFTAPVTGLYFFSASVTIYGCGTSNRFKYIRIRASNRDLWNRIENDHDSTALSTAICMDMDANDTIYIQVSVYPGSKDADIGGGTGYSQFSGTLLN